MWPEGFDGAVARDPVRRLTLWGKKLMWVRAMTYHGGYLYLTDCGLFGVMRIDTRAFRFADDVFVWLPTVYAVFHVVADVSCCWFCVFVVMLLKTLCIACLPTALCVPTVDDCWIFLVDPHMFAENGWSHLWSQV